MWALVRKQLIDKAGDRRRSASINLIDRLPAASRASGNVDRISLRLEAVSPKITPDPRRPT